MKHTTALNISDELKNGIAAYHRTWDRFNGLLMSARVGDNRKCGEFQAGNCQPTITTLDGHRYLIHDLGTIRVVE